LEKICKEKTAAYIRPPQKKFFNQATPERKNGRFCNSMMKSKVYVLIV